MKFNILTLHPDIFTSFLSNGLLGKAVDNQIIHANLINWREKYGVGGYKQVDDRPFGGSSGMVLQAEPVYQALTELSALSPLYQTHSEPAVHNRITPNNHAYTQWWDSQHAQDLPTPHNITISLTPRGFPWTQQIAEWVAEHFSTVTVLCGRYEGFDARMSDCVDLEISIGNYVLNGGEVPAMTVIESISRLVPGFLVKETSAEHDSFSSSRTVYREQEEYILGKKRLEQSDRILKEYRKNQTTPIFDNRWWKEEILPHIEHPQYTRPQVWNNQIVPPVLLTGDHKAIDQWRNNWYK